MTETLQIADLEFEVRRGPRRKTLGLTVDRAGELIVHAPPTATQKELTDWVNKKLLWVHRKLALKEEMNTQFRQPEFVSGETFFYLGQSYRLRVVDAGKSSLWFDGEWFHLRRADRPKAISHFRDWYVQKGATWLQERAAFWEARVNAHPQRIRVGDLGFNWGSCGQHRDVYFNWRLLQMPVRLIDYIVVHEMAHLIEHNHSRKFWKALDRVMPDWEVRKKVLETGWQGFASFGMEQAPPEPKK